ncbi:MAG: DUF3168 domain-containing protein [Sphingomonadales bacterium]
MTGFASWELQKAIFDALNTNVPLAAKVTGVFDMVPTGTAFPYVTMGDAKAKDWSSKTFNGQEHNFSIDVWSQDAGRMDTKEIMALVYGAIHDQPLVVSNNELVNLRHTDSEDKIEDDGITHHGILRFRAVTKEL